MPLAVVCTAAVLVLTALLSLAAGPCLASTSKAWTCYWPTNRDPAYGRITPPGISFLAIEVTMAGTPELYSHGAPLTRIATA